MSSVLSPACHACHGAIRPRAARNVARPPRALNATRVRALAKRDTSAPQHSICVFLLQFRSIFIIALLYCSAPLPPPLEEIHVVSLADKRRRIITAAPPQRHTQLPQDRRCHS